MYIDDLPVALKIDDNFYWVPILKFLPGFAYANGKLFKEFMSVVFRNCKLIISHPYHVQNIREILAALPRQDSIDQIREVHFTHFDTIFNTEYPSSSPLDIFSGGARLTKMKIDVSWSVGRGSWSISAGGRIFAEYGGKRGSKFGKDYCLAQLFKMRCLKGLDIEVVGESRPRKVNDAWASLYRWILNQLLQSYEGHKVVTECVGSLMKYRIILK